MIEAEIAATTRLKSRAVFLVLVREEQIPDNFSPVPIPTVLMLLSLLFGSVQQRT
jgi:hypothetical protein